MRLSFLSFLTVSLIILTTTFGGMVLFGMASVMDMGHETCVGTDCGSAHGATSGTDCLDHCLSTIPSASPAAPFSLFVAFAISLVAFVLSTRLTSESRLAHRSRRWREGIGKLLQQQSLSTVVLRN